MFKNCLLSLCVVLFAASSCLPLSVDTAEKNDNAELYGTEWSNDTQENGLKFYKGDKVLFFAAYISQPTGTFEYDASSGNIVFEGLTVVEASRTTEFSGATIEKDDNTKMKVYWHELGKTESHYYYMYRRR